MAKSIYLDYASATPLDPVVLRTVVASNKKYFGNPGAIHKLGVSALQELDGARKQIASVLGAQSEEVVFTSGATEANNLAILGVLQLASSESSMFRPHIITTNIEHPSVLEVCKVLMREKRALVDFVNVEPNGIVDPKKIKSAIKKNTILVSVMYANNEIGTIQPIREIAKVLRSENKKRRRKIIFHTDAVQAMNYLDTNVLRLGVDMLTLNGGKIYGPKGTGALYVKRGTPIQKVTWGGNQEMNLRAGTENLPGVMGLAKALVSTVAMCKQEATRLSKIQKLFFDKLKRSKVLTGVGMIINGDEKSRLPNNLSITIPKVPSDLLVVELSARGFHVSEKSACKSGDRAPSHVVSALRKENLESLRISLGRGSTTEDVRLFVLALEAILKKLERWYT